MINLAHQFQNKKKLMMGEGEGVELREVGDVPS
jgi:hypothetical protein